MGKPDAGIGPVFCPSVGAYFHSRTIEFPDTVLGVGGDGGP